MGMAARLGLTIGLGALVLTIPAAFFLHHVAIGVADTAVENARRDVAAVSTERASMPPLSPQAGREVVHRGRKLQMADFRAAEGGESEPLRLYRAVSETDETGSPTAFRDYYAPLTLGDVGPRLLSILLVVGSILAGATVALVLLLANRQMKPVRLLVEDISKISRGHLNHRIHQPDVGGEIALLGKAVDRMVRDLVEGQEVARELERSSHDVELLRELRRNLRPMEIPDPPGFQLETALLEASGAGSGDFVDTLDDGGSRPTLVVGGTATRGMSGQLLMTMTRAYLRGAILQGLNPAEACAVANESLNRDLETGLYASAMVAQLDPDTGKVLLVGAGHKAPAIRSSAEGALEAFHPNGIALGFDAGPVFQSSLQQVEIVLNPGGGLLLMSPAVYDCANAKGQVLGEKGARALAKFAFEGGLVLLEKKLRSFLGGSPEDDLTFALLRRTA